VHDPKEEHELDSRERAQSCPQRRPRILAFFTWSRVKNTLVLFIGSRWFVRRLSPRRDLRIGEVRRGSHHPLSVLAYALVFVALYRETLPKKQHRRREAAKWQAGGSAISRGGGNPRDGLPDRRHAGQVVRGEPPTRCSGVVPNASTRSHGQCARTAEPSSSSARTRRRTLRARAWQLLPELDRRRRTWESGSGRAILLLRSDLGACSVTRDPSVARDRMCH
jgi:hypothetical protein